MNSPKSVSASDLALLGKCECMVYGKNTSRRSSRNRSKIVRPQTLEMLMGESEHKRFESDIQQNLPYQHKALTISEKCNPRTKAVFLTCILLIITTAVAFS